MILCHHQRGAALGSNRLDNIITFLGIHTSCVGDIRLHGISCTFADLVSVKVNATHTGHSGKRNKLHSLVLKASSANPKLFFRQDHNTSAFRRLVRQGRKLRGISQFFDVNTVYRNEFRSLPVAQGDCAGFIQHQNIHITGSLNGPAAHGEDIGLIQPGHTCNTDGGKQRTDGGGCKANQKGNQRCYGSRILNSCKFS